MANDKKKRFNKKHEKPEFEQKLLDLARVTRVVKGGRRFRFRATVVIGDRKGRVGVGVAKGSDVSDAIGKAVNEAKKKMINVSIVGNTIAHDVFVKVGSAKILLKPALEGQGIIAGGAVRTVMDLAGIKDIVSKSLGTSNKLNVARATIEALKELKTESVRKPAMRKVIKKESSSAKDDAESKGKETGKSAKKKIAKKKVAKKKTATKKKTVK